MRTATVDAPTVAQQHAAERVLRHGAGNRRGGGFLNHADVLALVALLDRLRAVEATTRDGA